MGPHPETSAPAATPAGAEPAGQWCAALKHLNDEGLLACSRPVHDGDLHYDQDENVSWKTGRP
jgi:hypothetical protein